MAREKKFDISGRGVLTVGDLLRALGRDSIAWKDEVIASATPDGYRVEIYSGDPDALPDGSYGRRIR